MPQSAATYSVFWPRGQKTISISPLADRLGSLEGRTIAFLWDYLFRGDEIFPIIERAIKERFPSARFISYEEFGSTHGEGEQALLAGLPDKLKVLGAEAVISGMGC